ncbi:MAG TPA: pyridoxal-dependent decarboxylase [Porphyromonadaceae bacterium]|nr:pyridoxal-dependent decarboxylase [Porphyromonadaceae bacterium]
MNTLEEKQKEVAEKYNSEHFREQAHRVVDLLADYIAQSTQNREERMFCYDTPEKMYQKFKTDFREPAPYEEDVLIKDILKDVTQLHHPHYLGHQVSSPLPSSALADFCAALLNNSNCVYEMGPVACGIEKSVIDWLCSKIGFDESSGGFLTSGGSLGNLTALLAARQSKVPYDIWQEGVEKDNLCFLVSSQCHYSVKRAVAIMGLGNKNAIPIPVNENFQTDLKELEKAYNRAHQEGKVVLGVVANACCTATGSYDDLEGIGKFANEHNLWFHVDGAHGAPALLSETHKHKLKGIERADSVVWDAHKMMMTSAIVTGVLFKNADNAHHIFSQNASYILDRNQKNNWFDFALQTLECTKPFMSLKVYASLKLYGEKFFGDYVDYVYQLTSNFAEYIKQSDDFELAVEPQSNIICFRYIKSSQNLNELQISIREKILKSEKFYIVKTELNGNIYLRCTIINPHTKFEHLMELVEAIRKFAK